MACVFVMHMHIYGWINERVVPLNCFILRVVVAVFIQDFEGSGGKRRGCWEGFAGFKVVIC